MFNIVVFIAQSACQQCCSRYVVIAKPSEDQAEDDCNCDLTMSELLEYYNMSKTMDANCSRKDFLFQSGTHIINGEGMPIYMNP